MQTIQAQELCKMQGGVNLSGTLVNAFVNIIKTLFDVGKNLGSSFRRMRDDSMCPVK